MLKYAVLVFVALALSGCAQNTEAPVAQPTRQVQAEKATQQEQGAMASIDINILNAPDGQGVPDETSIMGPLVYGPLADKNLARIMDGGSGPAGSTVRDTRAGYVQNVYLTLQTGGSATGAQTTGGATGQSSTPGTTITQYPVQEPKASVTTPVAVGLPGSAPQATGTGTVEGNASTTADLQADLKTQLLDLAAKDPAAFQSILAELAKFFPVATTQPAVPQ